MNPKALHKISYGLYVVGSRKDERLNGQIANTVFQVTSQPCTVAVSISRDNLTHEFIRESKVFSVSILAQNTPLNFIGLFGFKSGRDVNKFQNVKYQTKTTGAPIVLDHSIGWLDCRVIGQLDVHTHTIFVGAVAEAEVINSEEPMSYAYYRSVKGGTAPASAPTYQAPAPAEVENALPKYKCTVCDYIYNPAKGDPAANIPPGTAFEDLPADWVCPVCGVPKSDFVKM